MTVLAEGGIARTRRDVAVEAAQARTRGERPRVHPNGFIQLDLASDGSRIAQRRLHVWPDGDDIPKQSVSTTIHDHRFDMRSTVLWGTLVQQLYAVRLEPGMGTWTHEIYMAQYPDDRKESVLGPTGVKVAVHPDLRGPRVVQEAARYRQHRYTFHDTHWEGLTATLMEKLAEDKTHEPRVLVPLGQKPDNTFVRADVDEDLLWDYIERALTS